MIKVGFVFAFQDIGWVGGINYYKNLLNAIYALPDRQIEPVIFVGTKTSKKFLDGFPPFQVIETEMLDRLHLKWYVRKLWIRAMGWDKYFEKILHENDIKVLSHHPSLGCESTMPTIGWIPDFQHKHLPEFFSEKELNQRDFSHKKICTDCSKIIVSSYDAQSDISLFNPESLNKVHVLQFAVNIDNVEDVPSLEGLEKKYKFLGPYFHMPNQFWVHKNHFVVVAALKILKAQGENITVLATGNTSDFRQPAHFRNLVSKIVESGLTDNFKILGLVPNLDLVGLMKNATAVINPSLFEGWSTTVEEAKSLGKKIILSDIAVHKEQRPMNSIYFRRNDPADLASAMLRVLLADRLNDNVKLLEAGKIELAVRIGKFATSYQNIIFDVLKYQLATPSL